jgi:hypothetical protein
MRSVADTDILHENRFANEKGAVSNLRNSPFSTVKGGPNLGLQVCRFRPRGTFDAAKVTVRPCSGGHQDQPAKDSVFLGSTETPLS